MWVRTDQSELVNLHHAHNIHVVEHGAPKFHIEVVALIGSERHILAYIPKMGAEGRQMAQDYVENLCASLGRCNHLYPTKMFPRHHDGPARR
jgi:hypothetical protein